MSGKSGVSLTKSCKTEIKAAIEKRKARLRKLAINVVIGHLSDGELCLKIIGLHFTHLSPFPCVIIIDHAGADLCQAQFKQVY